MPLVQEIAFAPVLFIFNVRLLAVFVFVKKTATLAPSVNTKPDNATVFAATFAAVLHTPKCVIFTLPLKFIPSIVLAVCSFIADVAAPPALEEPA